tara:strand:- start:1544 stop:1927 length:384 start_codon:yes stop_codon:yes gene_type:complete
MKNEKELPVFELESMTKEDKRFAAMTMVSNGHSYFDIVKVLGYGKTQAKKIELNVKMSGLLFNETPNFHQDSFYGPSVQFSDEMEYGESIYNLKYDPEELEGQEKIIYKSMVAKDKLEAAKTDFRDD